MKTNLRQVMITAATILLLVLLCAAPAAASAVDAVKFGGGSYGTAGDLAAAINAVKADTVSVSGDTLTLQKDLNITGTIFITGRMTILGDGHTIWRGGKDFYLINLAGSADLTLGSDETSKLTIDGQSTPFGGSKGLIFLSGVTFLRMNSGVNLTNNTASDNGGGVYNNGGIFTMSGGEISGNTAKDSDGGGVYIIGGTFTMSGGTISNNTAIYGGGVQNNGGTFTMSGGTISGNTADLMGGGVFVYNSNIGNTFTMSGGTISNNTAVYGGGVTVGSSGIFTMSGGEISGNTGLDSCGGVYILGGTFEMSDDATISGNTAQYNSGGGVYVDSGTFTMSGGTISENTANGNSGGVCVLPSGTFEMSGGTISGNTASINGGGVLNNGGTFTMSGGTISGNTAVQYGGGVYVLARGTFTMSGGIISGNTAPYGGGVYLYSGTFSMSGDATISDNTTRNFGGGVYVDSSGTFTMSGGTISGNTVTVRDGGGVFVASGGTFSMSGDATISGNTAKKDGYGVYLKADTYTMNGSAVVTADNDVYLLSGKKITVNGAMSGGGAQNITPAVTTAGTIVVSVDYSGGTAKSVKQYFGLKPSLASQQQIGLKAGGNDLKIVSVPSVNVGTVQIIPYNSTMANVSFNLTTVSPAKILDISLFPVSGGIPILIRYTGTFPADMGVTRQVSGITAGTAYTLNITPWSDSETKGILFTTTYTAPVPEIVFVNATTGAAITDPLEIANETTFIVRANITNSTWGELKHEIITWTEETGTFFTTSAKQPAYPYTITLQAVKVGSGNITVTLGSISKKLNITVTSVITAITLNPNGGSGGTPAVTAKQGSADLSTAITNPTNGTLIFNGWFNGAGGTGVQVINITGDLNPSVSGYTDADRKWTNTSSAVTLYANWTQAPVYTVTIQNDGHGTGSASPAGGAAGTAITLTSSPASGYQFKAWQVVQGSVSVSGSTFTMPAENVILKALFEPQTTPTPTPTQPRPTSFGSGDGNMNNAYRILFETFGGSFISPVTGLSSGDKIPAPPAPTKKGYTFDGWYTDEPCTKGWSFATGIPGDLTLYAKWTSAAGVQPTSAAATTVPQTVKTTPAVTPPPATTAAPVTTTAAGTAPGMTQAPAPVFGTLAVLLTAGVLLRRRE